MSSIRLVRWRERPVSDPEDRGAPGSSIPVRELVESWLAGRIDDLSGDRIEVLADNRRRQILRVRTGAEFDLVIKHFRRRQGARRLRDLIKSAVRRGADDREWRTLVRTHAAGIPCPEPLAHAKRSDGGRLLIQRFVPGQSIIALLDAVGAPRRRALEAVGTLVSKLHASGVVHRDLHVGNLLGTAKGPVLLDFQRAHGRASWNHRLADLGSLDFSLAHAGFSRTDRMRVHRAALEAAEAPSDRARLRAALRAIGEASRKRSHAYYRSRTRDRERPGRQVARIELPGSGVGLRMREFPEDAVAEAVANHRALAPRDGSPVTDPIGRAMQSNRDAILKRDHRAIITAVPASGRYVVVKEVRKRGLGRKLADVLRGSPGRRGWRGGNGLLVRGVRAAEPLAYLEKRRFGVPIESLLIIEDLRHALPLSELNFGSGEAAEGLSWDAILAVLVRLALQLHRRGIIHGDLQALHIYLAKGDAGPEPILIDFEGVRFLRELSAEQRMRDLAVLNASIGDHTASPEERRRAFRTYARAFGFERPPDLAERQIIEWSLERQSIWKGTDCGLTRTRPGASESNSTNP